MQAQFAILSLLFTCKQIFKEFGRVFSSFQNICPDQSFFELDAG
jgi:hypothetical protein